MAIFIQRSQPTLEGTTMSYPSELAPYPVTLACSSSSRMMTPPPPAVALLRVPRPHGRVRGRVGRGPLVPRALTRRARSLPGGGSHRARSPRGACRHGFSADDHHGLVLSHPPRRAAGQDKAWNYHGYWGLEADRKPGAMTWTWTASPLDAPWLLMPSSSSPSARAMLLIQPEL